MKVPSVDLGLPVSSVTTTTIQSLTHPTCLLSFFDAALEIGDNPACKDGCPTQISWKPQSKTERSIEMHEYLRSQGGENPRKSSRKRLTMSAPKRTKLLLQSGFDMPQIIATIISVDEVRRERRESLKANGFESLANILETTGRLPMNVLGTTNGILAKSGDFIKNSGKKTTDVVLNTTKATGDFIKNSGKKTTDAVVNTTKATGDFFKSSGKKTTDAVVKTTTATAALFKNTGNKIRTAALLGNHAAGRGANKPIAASSTNR